MNLIKASLSSKAFDYFQSVESNSLQNQSSIPVRLLSNSIINPLLKSEYDKNTEFW